MGGELDKVLQKALQKSQGNKEPDEVYGRRVRVWGESESGRKWTRYRERGRWMLEPVKSGERKYFGKEREDFVHAFKKSDEPRTWKERYVQVANRTGKTIVVRAEAYTRNLEEGERWVSAAEVRLAPGKKTSLKTEGGTQLRGSKLRIWATDADDEYFRWTEHKRRAIEVVAPEGYRREEIGDYLFVFDRVGRDEPGDR